MRVTSPPPASAAAAPAAAATTTTPGNKISSSTVKTPQMTAVTDSDIFATPSSTMAKRTKYEIRSAQKSARKNAADPVSWTLCLLSTAYSLWFIHLPGFILSKKSREVHTLRLGLLCLQRMQRRLLLRGSAHVDEICYRVMMQLCGAYGQPALAVQVGIIIQ